MIVIWYLFCMVRAEHIPHGKCADSIIHIRIPRVKLQRAHICTTKYMQANTMNELTTMSRADNFQSRRLRCLFFFCIFIFINCSLVSLALFTCLCLLLFIWFVTNLVRSLQLNALNKFLNCNKTKLLNSKLFNSTTNGIYSLW